METSDISLIELLHLSNLEQTVVVIANTLVPFQRSTLFNGNNHIICFDDVVRDFRHISSKDTFIDAREALTVHQIIYIKSIETLHKMMLFFNGTRNFVKLIVIIRMNPLIDE